MKTGCHSKTLDFIVIARKNFQKGAKISSADWPSLEVRKSPPAAPIPLGDLPG
jgi:hypothetical protein